MYFCLLLRGTYVTHILGRLIQVGLVIQTLGNPVHHIVLLLIVDRIVRVDRYGSVVERFRTLPQVLALQTLGDRDRGALEQLVHLANVAHTGGVFAQ